MKATTLQALAPRAIVVSVLLFGASLFAKVFPETSGAEVLLFGWGGAQDRQNLVAVFIWWGDLLLVMTWCCALVSSPWKAVLAGSTATLLGFCALLFFNKLTYYYSDSDPFRTLRLGYWFWLASVIAGLGGAIAGAVSDRARRKALLDIGKQ